MISEWCLQSSRVAEIQNALSIVLWYFCLVWQISVEWQENETVDRPLGCEQLWICDKQNLMLVIKNYIKLVQENVKNLARGLLFNNFLNSYNKILYTVYYMTTHLRSSICDPKSDIALQMRKKNVVAHIHLNKLW